MGRVIEYSVLRYIPSRERGESINLGVLFFDRNSEEREFVHINNFERLKAFDDELDMKFVQALLVGIEKDIMTNLFKQGKFSVGEFTKFYFNEFCFDEVETIDLDREETTIQEISKFFLKYDYSKKDRLSSKQNRKILNSLIEAKHISIEKNKVIRGRFNDRIVYDYSTRKYNIKYFDINKRNLSRLVTNVKIWAWNAKYSNDGKEVLILYNSRDEELETDEFKSITEIANAAGILVMNSEDGIAKIG